MQLTPQNEKRKMDDFTKACRQAGLKITPQRVEIFRELIRAKDHPSAETIHSRVRERLPFVSLDTVYRTLQAFEDMGAATRAPVFDDRGRFDGDVRPHHHFVCVRCKRIEDFEWEGFDRAEPPDDAARWGRVDSRQAVLRGICQSCMQDAQQGESH